MTVKTDEGVVYTLRYGEVVIAAGDEFSAGTEPSKEAKDLGKATEKATKSAEGTSEGRYLFVTATFDPSMIPPPKPSTNPDDKFPDDPFAYEEGEKNLVPREPCRQGKGREAQS